MPITLQKTERWKLQSGTAWKIPRRFRVSKNNLQGGEQYYRLSDLGTERGFEIREIHSVLLMCRVLRVVFSSSLFGPDGRQIGRTRFLVEPASRFLAWSDFYGPAALCAGELRKPDFLVGDWNRTAAVLDLQSAACA